MRLKHSCFVLLLLQTAGEVVPCNLVEVQVQDAPDVFKILERGIHQRRTAGEFREFDAVLLSPSRPTRCVHIKVPASRYGTGLCDFSIATR